jgi:hypothetical protein
MSDEKWISEVKSYCSKYNVPVDFLAEIISDPKVIPMIRGKAFEFSTMLKLQEILPKSEWIVDKPYMNAQFGIHDMDVRIIHIATQKTIGIECKLAAKGSFKITKNGDSQIKVKCMRSRTLGDKKANELALKIGIDPYLLNVHNDQYLQTDFEVVITSIANAFYETDDDTAFFEWKPTELGNAFLKKISTDSPYDLQGFAFNQLYIASTKNLIISKENGVNCTRKTCPNPSDCGFIPNYPIITFSNNDTKPQKPWFDIQNADNFFKNLIQTS